MNDIPKAKDRINWNCAQCNSVLQVEVGTKYGSCSTCGATFGFEWVGDQLGRSLALNEITSSVKKEQSEETIQVSNTENKMDLRELNDKIRRLEMTKGGERIRALSVFTFICTVIYYLFTLTVHGIARVTNPEVNDLIVAGVAAISLLVIIVYRLYRGAIVRKCNAFIAERNKLEEHIKNLEVSLGIPNAAQKDKQQVTTEEGPKEKDLGSENQQSSDSSIIEKFASRKKQRRSRLNIRDDS